jgi:hypothetical protein
MRRWAALGLVLAMCGVAACATTTDADQAVVAVGRSARSASPAASPAPAGITETTLPPVADPCASMVEVVAAAQPTAVGPDALGLVADGSVASPPFDPAPAVPGWSARYATVEEFLDGHPNIVDPAGRRDAMQRNGFVGAVDLDLNRGADLYNVLVVRFASPEQAIDYFGAHMASVCATVEDVRAVPGPQGAVAYWQSTPQLGEFAKAVFVAGDTEVNLALCYCSYRGSDDIIGDWVRVVWQQLQP